MAKKNRIAVAITPEMGIEVAELNFNTGCIVKYANRRFDQQVTIRNIIPDMDMFKELLHDCFVELGVKNAEVVLILPTISMGLGSYMASQANHTIIQSIADDLTSKELIFRDNDPLVALTSLSVTIQSKIVAYTASIYPIVQEAAQIICNLGHKIEAIDTSFAATYRTLVQTGKAQIRDNENWMFLLVDGSAARLMALNGDTITEYFEEQIMFDYTDTIGNCDMVISAMQSYWDKVPANYLYIVSRTDNVSAEILAQKLNLNKSTIFLEANGSRKEAFIDAPSFAEDIVMQISPDVIGGCLYDEGMLHFNLFTEDLGDVYLNQQPLVICGVTVTVPKVIALTALILALILGPTGGYWYYLSQECKTIQESIDEKDRSINELNAKIRKYDGLVSTDKFNEKDQIKIGLAANTDVYNYMDLLGKDTPSKLWLTGFQVKKTDTTGGIQSHIAIEGQADNIDSIYTFYRNIRDSVDSGNAENEAKLQKLGLANKSTKLDFSSTLPENGFGGINSFNENSNDIILSSNADFYEFVISNKTLDELKKEKAAAGNKGNSKKGNKRK